MCHRQLQTSYAEASARAELMGLMNMAEQTRPIHHGEPDGASSTALTSDPGSVVAPVAEFVVSIPGGD